MDATLVQAVQLQMAGAARAMIPIAFNTGLHVKSWKLKYTLFIPGLAKLSCRHKTWFCLPSVKKLSLLFLVCTLCTPVYSQYYYKIKGRFASVKNGTVLYLSEVSTITRQYSIVDSTIYKNGFYFKGQCNELSFYTIQLKNYKVLMSVIIENGPIRIFEKNGIYFRKGGLQNDFLTEEEKIRESFKVGIKRLSKIRDSLALKKNDGYQIYNDSLIAIEKKKSAFLDSFYIQNNNAFVGLSYLWGALPILSIQQVTRIFQHLTPELKHHSYGLILEKYITSGLMNAEDIEQKDTSGKKVIISFPYTKYILLDFWASWCVPCRENNTKLKDAYKKYKTRNFELVSISADDDLNRWKHAIQKTA